MFFFSAGPKTNIHSVGKPTSHKIINRCDNTIILNEIAKMLSSLNLVLRPGDCSLNSILTPF